MNVRELTAIVIEHYAQQSRAARCPHAAACRLFKRSLGDWLRGAKAYVRREHFRRLQIDRSANAAHEKANSREGGHCDRERKQQYPQLSRAPLPHEHSHGK